MDMSVLLFGKTTWAGGWFQIFNRAAHRRPTWGGARPESAGTGFEAKKDPAEARSIFLEGTDQTPIPGAAAIDSMINGATNFSAVGSNKIC
jgi:hypothetical protein